MNSGINLISSKKQELERQEKVVKNFRRVAYGCLTVVALVSVGLFAVNFFSPLPKINLEEQQAAQDLLSQKAKIAKLLLLRDRLKNIDSIRSQNSSLEKELATIALNVPGDSTLETLGIAKDGVSIIITASSLASINSFVNFLNDEVAKKDLFRKVTISSLALDVKNGTYTLSVTAAPL